MKPLSAPQLRNVAVVGHNGVGKTTLVAALLHAAGVLTRPGRVEDGTCPTDFDAEEIDRKISINLAVAHAVHRDMRINFLDAPGYGIFAPEARSAVYAADAALIVLDAVSGVEVQTERVWKFAQEFERPVMFVVNRMDRERASFDRVVESLHKKFGRGVIPLQIPVGEEKAFRGTVDLVRMEAHLQEDGKRIDAPIPEGLAARAKAEHEKLVETVAEGEDDLMEKFFAQGTLEAQDIVPGLKREIVERKVFPVLCTSSQLGVGAIRILDACVALLPSPESRRVEGVGKDGKPVVVFCNEKDHAVAQVFKTVSDPFAGRISYMRVFAGHFQSDGSYWNATRSVPERFAGLFLPQGKEHVTIPEAKAGDIVAVSKLKETLTGDSITTKDNPVVLPALTVPEASIAYAIEPKAKGDEDKISTALHKLIEEDPSLAFQRDEETKEFHLAGASQLHVEIAVARLKKRYGVEVILHPPKVPYRETITRKAEAHGRHKKQTGGHGQFADCKIKVEPLPRGKDFEFVDDIYGGAIPRNFIPAVEKGIQEVRRKGYLAGYPIMNVEITAPNEYVGDLMGDLSSRRGQVQGMEANEDDTVIRALAPMAELLTYGAQLRSITQGRGSFHLEFSHYAEVPHSLQDKIIAQARAGKAEAKEA
jgi:elongation factor G